MAKGRKDRIAPLSNKTILLLREYFKIFKLTNYLFEGQNKEKAYDARSIQLVLKNAIQKTKIKKLLPPLVKTQLCHSLIRSWN